MGRRIEYQLIGGEDNNNNNNNNNNQYIYKKRQSHAMSQRRWLATAVIFRPSDNYVFRFRRNVNSDSSGDRRDAGRRFQSAGPYMAKARWPVAVRDRGTNRSLDDDERSSAAGDDPGCQQADDRDHSSTPGHDRGCTSTRAQQNRRSSVTRAMRQTIVVYAPTGSTAYERRCSLGPRSFWSMASFTFLLGLKG